ncbi:unnamed protein product, partial [Mesorhabditis belari]|uniref:RING-type domain-containing protein n=1 Tax=Mesorhabditis belari TaxID=2138241 RepID=A0AAF3ESX9_9BILA
MSPNEVLAGLLPTCICGAQYDSRQSSPQILSCAHTFCLRCLTNEEQAKKRKCPLCKEKYKKFALNVALLETIERIILRRDTMENISRRCDDCDQRWPMAQMRRCRSCEDAIASAMVSGRQASPQQVVCIVCLHCAVDRHSGHNLPQIYVRDRHPVRSFPPSMVTNTPQPHLPSTPPPGDGQKRSTFPFRLRPDSFTYKRTPLGAAQFTSQYDQLTVSEMSEGSSQKTHSPTSSGHYSRRPLPPIPQSAGYLGNSMPTYYLN